MQIQNLDQQFLDEMDKLPFKTAVSYTLSYIRCSLYTLPVLLACLVFVRPNLPDLRTSLSSHPLQLGLIERVVLAILQSYTCLLLCDVGLLIIVSGFPFLFALLDLLGIMR